MLALALTPRWLGYLALTVVFSIVAGFFGAWQWDRREAAVSIIETVTANYDLPPTPVKGFLSNGGSYSADDEWKPVLVQGIYVPEDQVLVRTRPRSGQVGFEILLPIRTATGETIAINRGWVPTGETTDYPDSVPEPPTGTVSLTGRLKPAEPTLVGRGAPAGQLSSIDLVAYQSLLDYPIEPVFYLQLVDEDSPGARAGIPPIKPVPDEGPHLSYTLQWFVFAGMAFFAYFWLLRTEHRANLGILPTLPRKRSDADEEDALLETIRL
jgi:cytochrome oxidase assembly protein ShyY1